MVHSHCANLTHRRFVATFLIKRSITESKPSLQRGNTSTPSPLTRKHSLSPRSGLCNVEPGVSTPGGWPTVALAADLRWLLSPWNYSSRGSSSHRSQPELVGQCALLRDVRACPFRAIDMGQKR